MRILVSLLVFLLCGNVVAQPIGEQIIFEMVEDDTAISLNKPIKSKSTFFLRNLTYPQHIKLGKYKVFDEHTNKRLRGFKRVVGCNTCFKKSFLMPGHVYELISILNVETKDTMRILVNFARSHFRDAYLGITFKPGDFVFTFMEDYKWGELKSFEAKEKQYFKFKDSLSLGLNITPNLWENHKVKYIHSDSVYADARFKMYQQTDTLTTAAGVTSLHGTYRERTRWNENNCRTAFMKIDKHVELAIKVQSTEENTYQYLKGSSLEQISDSLFTFRGDTSWQITSINQDRNMLSYPNRYLNNKVLPEHEQALADSCENYNPFEKDKLLSTKISVGQVYGFSFRPLVAQLFDTFQIISSKSVELASYDFTFIDQFWWCKNLNIPTPFVDSFSIKLAIKNPIDNQPLELLLKQGCKHSLHFGIADPRNYGQYRVMLYLKVLSSGELQISYQYPLKDNRHSILAIVGN